MVWSSSSCRLLGDDDDFDPSPPVVLSSKAMIQQSFSSAFIVELQCLDPIPPQQIHHQVLSTQPKETMSPRAGAPPVKSSGVGILTALATEPPSRIPCMHACMSARYCLWIYNQLCCISATDSSMRVMHRGKIMEEKDHRKDLLMCNRTCYPTECMSVHIIC